MHNFYKILNVPPTAKDAEIKKALHETLRLWTNRTNAPQIDRRQEAERMVKLIEEAETILLNTAKRAEYDKQLKNEPPQQATTDKTVLDAAQDLVAEGRKLLADGNIGDALYVATKATEQDGGNPEAWALLGKARYLFGDVEDAIYEYKRAIKLKPNEGVYYSELGDIFNDTGKFDDALTQYKRAAQVEPGVAWYRADVGRLLAKQGNLEEAVQILEQCLKEEPDVNAFRSWLTLAYLDSAANCCSVDPDTGNYYPTSKAQILAAIGFVKKAEKLNIDDQGIKSAVEQNKRAIRESIQRKYNGSTGAAIVGGVIWFCAYGLGLIFLPFYFFASRPPKYAIYKRVLGQEATGTQKTFQAAGKVADVIGANENVRGGIGWAILIGTGLFLPVMAVVNYFKNYTGENDIKDIESLLRNDSKSSETVAPPQLANAIPQNTGAVTSPTTEQQIEPTFSSPSNKENTKSQEKPSSALQDTVLATSPVKEQEVKPIKASPLSATGQQARKITISIPANIFTKKPFLISAFVFLVLCCAAVLLYSLSRNATLAYQYSLDGRNLPANQTPEVKVDGQHFESGNHLKPGRHEISVRLENVEPYERHFWLFYGTKDLGNLPLETSKGSLVVTVNPSPATVLVQRGGHEHLMKDLVVRSVPSDTDEVIPPAPPYYFNDYAHVVSSAMVSRLNTMLENYERQSSDQILVAVFPKMQSDAPIKDYTLRVANSWKVGQKAKNNGVALFVFVQDRKMYVQVGTGLENELPDPTCQQILDTQISPRLKEGDFDGGLSAGVTAIIAAIKRADQGNGLTVAKMSNAVANPSENNLILQRSGEVVCQGAAPLSVEKLPVGNYTLVVKRGDYEETRTVDIQRQQTTKEMVELNLGVVELSSDPAGADYEMSGNRHHWQGKLPARVEDVPVGDYSLSVTRQGWEMDSNVSVVRGTVITNGTEFPYGSIEVTSKPTGLVVSTNGVEIGKTPITLQELKPAFYNLTVSDGENDLMAQIHVGPKENAKYDPVFRYGMVQLTTTPPGATVFRKGKEVGKTPIPLKHIPAGESAVELRLAGYVFTNFAFVGVADTTTSYTVNLVSEQYLSDLSEARRAAAGSPPDYLQALAKIAEALKIYPDNADALQLQKDYQFGLALNEASALLDKGDLDQASKKIDAALALKPSDTDAFAVKEKIVGAIAQRDRVAKEEADRQSEEKAREAGVVFQQHISNIFDLVRRNPFSMGGQPFAFKTESWRVHASPARAETAMLDAAQLCTPVWQVESKAQPLSGATQYHLRQKVLLGSSFEKLEVQICELPNKDVDIRANLVVVIMPDNDPNHPARMRQLGAGYFTTFISHFSHALQSNPLAQTPPVNSPPTYEQHSVVTQPGVNYKY